MSRFDILFKKASEFKKMAQIHRDAEILKWIGKAQQLITSWGKHFESFLRVLPAEDMEYNKEWLYNKALPGLNKPISIETIDQNITDLKNLQNWLMHVQKYNPPHINTLLTDLNTFITKAEEERTAIYAENPKKTQTDQGGAESADPLTYKVESRDVINIDPKIQIKLNEFIANDLKGSGVKLLATDGRLGTYTQQALLMFKNRYNIDTPSHKATDPNLIKAVLNYK